MDARVDLTTCELLRGVERLGSLGLAAEAVGVSQQAASARLRTAERRLGRVLARRTRTGSVLTDDGRLLLGWALPVLESADQLLVALDAWDAEVGQVEVAASQTISEELLPGWLAAFHRERTPASGERLPVRLMSGNSSFVVDHVRAHPGVLGFIETPDVPADLVSEVVGSDELVLLVDPGHRWARRRRAVSAEQLAGTSLVTRESGSGTRRTVEAALARHRPALHPAAPAAELASTPAIRSAAASGLAPAVLSLATVRGDLATGRLHRVRTEVDLRRPLTAIWHGRLHEDARALLALARRQLTGGGATGGQVMG